MGATTLSLSPEGVFYGEVFVSCFVVGVGFFLIDFPPTFFFRHPKTNQTVKALVKGKQAIFFLGEGGRREGVGEVN